MSRHVTHDKAMEAMAPFCPVVWIICTGMGQGVLQVDIPFDQLLQRTPRLPLGNPNLSRVLQRFAINASPFGPPTKGILAYLGYVAGPKFLEIKV